ncbi:YggS family pyridoxal phosphate-dependent enzyme [Microbacterium sp. MM2322]|uniref:YggS family pyridoxal phosphate-dependent enzyme n=1 Tax=Microbacterium sp. MM2322 TaxID=3157631 RepID=UPI0032D57796
MDLGSRLADIDARISDAARSAGRDATTITRIVVTKFHPVELVQDLADLGVTDVGENRQQELSSKRETYAGRPLRWHFIGQAQTNKARAVRRDADAVHSLDRARLADSLHTARREDDESDILDVLIQVNLTDDPGRGGVEPSGIVELAEHVAASCPSLRLRGVMAVAPLDEEPAPAFARLADYAGLVRGVVPDAEWISAGMTGDFAEAIAAGATHLRIGSAITGPRPVHG